jgi:hypothetical protein
MDFPIIGSSEIFTGILVEGDGDEVIDIELFHKHFLAFLVLHSSNKMRLCENGN